MVPDIPVGDCSTGSCMDERDAISFLCVFEDVGEDRFSRDRKRRPRGRVDSGGHDESQQWGERKAAVLALGVVYVEVCIEDPEVEDLERNHQFLIQPYSDVQCGWYYS